MVAPLPKGDDGRDPRTGRWLPGCTPGPGNPHAAAVARLRAKFLACVTEDALAAAVEGLLEQAKRGNVAACRVLFEYALGRPPEAPPDLEDEAPVRRVVEFRLRTDPKGGTDAT